MSYKNVRPSEAPILRSGVEAANTPAPPKHTTRQATFAEAIDMGLRPHEALVKCEPSTTKEITKERLQVCIDANFDVNDLAKAFRTSTPNMYFQLAKHQLKLNGKKPSKKKTAAPSPELVLHQAVTPQPVVDIALNPDLIPDSVPVLKPTPDSDPIPVPDLAPVSAPQPSTPSAMRLVYISATSTVVTEAELLKFQRIESAARGIAGEIQWAVDQCPEDQRAQLAPATEFLAALKVTI